MYKMPIGMGADNIESTLMFQAPETIELYLKKGIETIDESLAKDMPKNTHNY
jgi:hypothetical protein